MNWGLEDSTAGSRRSREIKFDVAGGLPSDASVHDAVDSRNRHFGHGNRSDKVRCEDSRKCRPIVVTLEMSVCARGGLGAFDNRLGRADTLHGPSDY